MELVFTENIKGEFSLFVGNNRQTVDELYADLAPHIGKSEKMSFEKIKNEKRKKEWLGARILLREIIGKYTQIFYDQKGKPFVNENFFVSVSHTDTLIAVLVSKNPELGVDIEKISERILKTAHKFTDKTFTESADNETLIKFFHLKWSAKETLYKIYGKGIPDYIKHLNVEIPKIKTNGNVNGTINLEDFNKTYNIKYLFFKLSEESENEFLLTWSV
jgi:phosphopantetheinyl transferase